MGDTPQPPTAGVTAAPSGRPATSSAIPLHVEGRLGGFLFLAGAGLCAGAAVIPHPAAMDVVGFWWLSLGQLLLAALLFGAAWARTSVRWLRAFTLIGAIAAVTAAIYLNGERDGGPALMNEFFYVWPAVYAGYFYSRGTIAGVLAGIVAAYCGVLLAVGAATEVFAYRLTVTISVVAGTAATAHALRLQVNGLLGRLRQMATTDSLTSLLNRRAFDDRLRREIERSGRNAEPLALVVGDVDRFKDLNDDYGHPCGDQVLADIGRLLLDSSRAIDVVARIGGEEFALVLPATPSVQAFETAERLRRRVADLRDPGGKAMTMSFGVVVAPGDGKAEAHDMVEASDVALYAAKHRGRDRTVVYSDDLPRKQYLGVVPAV
jgi:diguanylate cyclase (GGDEF)-like protein